MKTGIVTFFDHDNYGAMLQAYALRKKLMSFGTEAEFLSFAADGPVEGPAPAVMTPLLKKIRQESDRRHASFCEFRSKYLPSAAFSEKIADNYDRFVAGSDQIWNPEITKKDDRYFLPFARPEQKISYAASFGKTDFSAEEKAEMRPLLESFGECLSMREQEGAALVKEITGKEIPVCVDPVLLTKEDDWNELCRKREAEPYLLLITVQNDTFLLKEAKKLAEEKGLAFKVITASFFPPVGFAPWSGVGVTDWLDLLRNASFVVTSSFHGLAFSVIFEREFLFYPLQNELAGRNGRMTELLEDLELTDRKRTSEEPICWEKVREKKAILSARSEEFLRVSLGKRLGL